MLDNPLLKSSIRLPNFLMKGEGPGHPFRGNQYTEGQHGGFTGAADNKHFGQGYWYDVNRNQAFPMKAGELGPHGDHDGWIAIDEHAKELGLDPKEAAAFKIANFGPMASLYEPDNANVHEQQFVRALGIPSGDVGFDWWEAHKFDKSVEAEFEKVFNKTWDEATAWKPDNLLRVRKWPDGQLTINLAENLKQPAPLINAMAASPEFLQGVRQVTVEANDLQHVTLGVDEFLDGKWLRQLKKGEGPGHPFRGNQYISGSTGEATTGDAANLKSHIDLVARMMEGQGIYGIVSKNGQAYPFDLNSFVGSTNRLGQCYKYATQAVWNDPKLTYVEGFITVHGVPIQHAWTVGPDGKVHDPTLPKSSMKSTGAYFGVPIDRQYLNQTALRTEVYGVISGTNPDIFNADPKTFVRKGEGLGHPFRGNQYVDGPGYPMVGEAGAETIMPLRRGTDGGLAAEAVARAAIRIDGQIFLGWDHADALERAAKQLKVSFNSLADRVADSIDAKAEDGFITSTGRFVDRVEALRIARVADQVDESPEAGGQARWLDTAYLKLIRLLKGDKPGHPFRGNQYRDVAGGGVPTVTAYHGTSQQVLDAILKEGIVAGRSKSFATSPVANELYYDDRSRSVYLTDSLLKAEFYANRVASQAAAAEPNAVGRSVPLKPVILELKVPKAEWAKFREDEHDLGGRRREMKIPPAWIVKATEPKPGYIGVNDGKVLYQKAGAVTVYAVIFVQEPVEKGEGPGHPFRGNQYVEGVDVPDFNLKTNTIPAQPHGPDKTPRVHMIFAYSGNKRIGTLQVHLDRADDFQQGKDPGYLRGYKWRYDYGPKPYVEGVVVDEAFRRRGVASALYREAERVMGQYLTPSPELLPEGRQFWEGYRPGALVGHKISKGLDQKKARFEQWLKGEGPGHPFRGNQYVTGLSGSEKPAWLEQASIQRDANGETIPDLLARHADPREIDNHPAMVAARNIADSLPPTDGMLGYGTDQWRNEREFEEGLVGYDQAANHLLDVAGDYAGGMDQVRTDREATIILGPPASGKSTFAEQLARDMNAAIADPDDAKRIFKEFRGGIGANAVHEESSVLSGYVLGSLIGSGSNLVLPKVGGNAASIERLTRTLQLNGYKINLVNVDVNEDNAFRRAVRRFLSSGRLISSDYTREVDGNPTRTYDSLKTNGNYAAYASVDANGAPGTHVVTEGKDSSIGQALNRAR